MRGLLRDPLVHFLIGGALLFALYGVVGDDSGYLPDRIVVDEARVEGLIAAFQRTWMRPPTKDELDGLVHEFVNEEVLVREGLALGLDRDDPVIRRRLRQKVEFLNTDLVAAEKPTEAELAAFLSSRRDRFEEPARVSFRQIFVSPEPESSAARSRAKEFLGRLRAAGGGAPVVGDRTLLPEAMLRASERDVASVFGEGFAGDLHASTGDDWTGPVASNYGLHLIRVDERLLSRVPELEEIRPEVEREYESVQRAEATQRVLQRLRERYEIEIRMPSPDSASPSNSMGG